MKVPALVEVKAKRIKLTMMMHVPHRRRSTVLNGQENIYFNLKTSTPKVNKNN